jgi:O-antigen/teichoic acid export membrane protein
LSSSGERPVAQAGEHARQEDAAHAARSGAVQVLTVAAQALITVTHVLLARLFGPVVFGGYQACLAILEVLTRGGTGGADKGMLRYIAGFRARGETNLARSALGTGLRLCLGVSGVASLLVILLADPIARLSHDPAMATGLRLLAPVTILTGTMWVLVQASLAAKVTRANFIVRGVSEPTLLLLAGLTAALIGRTLAHLALAHMLAAGVTLALAVLVVGRVFGRGEIRRALAAPRLRGFADFSIPLGLADLTNAILQRADIVLLTMFIGPRATAIYAAAEFVTRVTSNARYVFDSIAAPMFSEAIHLGDRERLRDNLRMITRWVSLAAAPIAVTVVALRHDLLALYGPDFAEGAAALSLLAMGHLVNAMLGLTGWILTVSGRSRAILMNNIIAAAANVVMGVTLIPRFGLVGTAIAALGSVTLVNVLVVVEVWRWHGVHAFGLPVAKPLIAAAATLVVELAVARYVEPVAARVVLLVLAGLATYLTGLFALGLAPEDRRLLTRLRAKIAGRLGRGADGQ